MHAFRFAHGDARAKRHVEANAGTRTAFRIRRELGSEIRGADYNESMSNPVRDNKQMSRFEMDADGHVAFSEYRRDGGSIEFRHTEVPKELEGRGIGSALVKGALALAKADGLQIRARCPFVKAYLQRHPEEG